MPREIRPRFSLHRIVDENIMATSRKKKKSCSAFRSQQKTNDLMNYVESLVQTSSSELDCDSNLQTTKANETPFVVEDPTAQTSDVPTSCDLDTSPPSAEEFQPTADGLLEELENETNESIESNNHSESEGQAEEVSKSTTTDGLTNVPASAHSQSEMIDDEIEETLFESLSARFEKLETTSQTNDTSDRPPGGLSSTQNDSEVFFNRFEQRVDAFFERLEQRLTAFLGEARNRSLSEPDTTNNTTVDSIAAESEEVQFSDVTATPSMASLDWDRRKRQLLADHGEFISNLDDASQPATATATDATTATTDLRQTPRLGMKTEDEALEALHESIESLDRIDSAEIDNLKEQLTSKLRDAEVELSINRAKLSQQWAALEQKQAEISQRESALKSKYSQIDESNKKPRLLDRISRHLSRNPQNPNET